jgi:peptidylprolyl isomerase/peptidyl-prolyl cis-trans isomerase A (cyclophilin A)
MSMIHRAAIALAVLAAPALLLAEPPQGAAGQQPENGGAARKAPAKAEAKSRKADEAKGGEEPGAAKGLYATFVTSAGKIGVQLFPEQKPGAVKNFVELAEGKKDWTDPRTGQRTRRPLYDGTVFHRVIPGFMIQGGDPLGLGVGGPGYAIPDELQEGERFFEQPCQLAYANSGPNSSGSQFFITEVPTLHLNPVKCSRSPSGLCGYVRFGQGICGCDLVGKIAVAGNNKTTLEKVVISKVKPTCQ